MPRATTTRDPPLFKRRDPNLPDAFGRLTKVSQRDFQRYMEIASDKKNHLLYNYRREVFAAADVLSLSHRGGLKSARRFMRAVPHLRTTNDPEREIVNSLLQGPLPLGEHPQPLFRSEVIRYLPRETRQALYRLYRGGVLEVAAVLPTRTGRQHEPFFWLIVGRPRRLLFEFAWGGGLLPREPRKAGKVAGRSS